MDKLIKSLDKIASAKILVALIIIGLVAFFVYRNFDFITEITFKIDRSKKNDFVSEEKGEASKKEKGTDTKVTPYSDVRIENIQISPIDFDLPAYFFLELQNRGTKASSGDSIIIDFGRANIENCEIRPKDSCKIIAGDEGGNLLKIGTESTAPKQSIYVYALLTRPSFKKIIIESKDKTHSIFYSFDDYLKKIRDMGSSSGGYMTFWKVVGTIALFIFAAYLFIAFLVLLNRKLFS